MRASKDRIHSTSLGCLGDVVIEGVVVQTSSKKNVNFGIRKGQFVIGYIEPEEVHEGEPFDTLVSGFFNQITYVL